MSAEEKIENGATKSFKIHVECSYAELGNTARGKNTILEGIMGEYLNTLQGMMLIHHQGEMNELEEAPVVWFRDSHPKDDKP